MNMNENTGSVSDLDLMQKAILSMEDHPEYLSKVFLGNDDSTMEMTIIPVKRGKIRPCAWIRNRQHKKAEWRRFLNINPAMDVGNAGYLPGYNMIYLFGGEKSWRTAYALNPYNHRFLSKQGDVRVLRGKLQKPEQGCIETLSPKIIKNMKYFSKRYVRRAPIDEDRRASGYAFYRKRHKERYD